MRVGVLPVNAGLICARPNSKEHLELQFGPPGVDGSEGTQGVVNALQFFIRRLAPRGQLVTRLYLGRKRRFNKQVVGRGARLGHAPDALLDAATELGQGIDADLSLEGSLLAQQPNVNQGGSSLLLAKGIWPIGAPVRDVVCGINWIPVGGPPSRKEEKGYCADDNERNQKDR